MHIGSCPFVPLPEKPRNGLEVFSLTDREYFFSSPFLRLFVPFGLAYFMSIFLGSANSIMSPILIETFGLSPANLGFMSSIYIVSFGIAQIPLGVMLDRYGAGRTLAPLLLFAVAGTLVFAMAKGLLSLVLSRVLMGIGLSGCLMASFKGYADCIERERLPLVYSLQSFIGGLGGMVATRPLALAFEWMHWRGVFVLLSLAVLLAAALVRWKIPRTDSGGEKREGGFFEQFTEMMRFSLDARFWEIAPISLASEALIFSYLFLWLGPWMRDVALLPEEQTGRCLLLASGGAAAGYLLNGVIAGFLRVRGWMSWEGFYLSSGVLLTCVLLLIVLCSPGTAVFLWPVAAFLATMAMMAFPLLRNRFSLQDVGRVLSLLNLLIFVVAFAMQWLIGVILNFYPVLDRGFSPTGYRVGLLVIIGLNVLADLHFSLSRRNGQR